MKADRIVLLELQFHDGRVWRLTATKGFVTWADRIAWLSIGACLVMLALFPFLVWL